jgi:hypothetical protein
MRASAFALVLAVPVAFFAACGGGGLTPGDGTSATGGLTGSGGTPVGTGGTGPTTGGSASVGGMGGEDAGGAGGADTGTGGTDTEGCNPRVHLLIQRSGAMFNFPSPEDFWWEAVAAALDGGGDLLGEFEAQIEISASVFTKVMGEATCPLGSEVSAPVGAGDLADVLEDEEADYRALVEATTKVDAPVVDAVEAATTLLGGQEDAYIVLVASGIPDSCEADDVHCTTEEVLGAVLSAYDAGIQTRLLYLSSDDINLYPEGVANAGAGEGVEDLYLGCTTGFEYSETPGDAAFEAPADTASIEQALRDLLTDIASCN